MKNRSLFLILLLALFAPWAAMAQDPQLNEGFESTTFPPEDWASIHVSGANSWARNTSYHHTGSASAYAHWANAGHENYLITPKLAPASDESLSFYVAAQSYSGTTLYVKVSTTTADASAFSTTLATYTTGSSGTIGTTSTSTWVEKTIDLSDYVGQQIFIAFHVVDNNGGDVIIDDVTGVTLYVASCAKPTGLAVNNGVATWNAGTASQWNLKYKKVSDETWISVNGLTAASYTFSGLDAATDYEVQVQTDCGGGDLSDWTSSASFTTPCEEITSFPWTEDFTGLTAGIPICWDNSEGTTTTATYKWSYYNAGHTAVPCLRFNSYSNSNNNTNFLKTPVLNFPANKEMQLVFWWKNPTGGDFSVFISTDGGSTYTTSLATALTGQSDWAKKEIDLTDYIGSQNVVIVFKGTSNYGSGDAYLYLDDVTVREKPNCLAPTDLAADAFANSAELSWTANSSETSWKLYWKKSSDANYTEVATGVTNPYTLEGLDAASNYAYYVVANCSSTEQSEPSDVYNFVTACGTIGIGYTCGFEGPNTGGTTSYPLPACWTKISSDNYPYVYSYGTPRTGSYHLYFYSSSSYTATRIAVLPEIDGGLNGKRLSFYQKGAYSFSVGYMTDPTNASTFVAVETKTGSSSYQLFEVDFGEYTGDPRYIAIKSNFSSTYQSMYFDDVALVNSPTCFRPTMVTTATNIGPTSATVSWTAGSTDQDHWDVYYCTSPYTAPTASTVPQVTNTADNPCTLTGLMPSTSYRVWVRGNCGSGDVSEWSTNYCTFSTPAYCADMQVQYSTINFTDLAYNTVTVNWTAAGAATQWKVQCSTTSDFATVAAEELVTAATATLSGLTAETPYYVRIAPYCAEADDYTPWSSNKSFTTTESCPAPVLAEPTNTTAYGATLTWTGTSDHYDVMVAQETITTVLDADFEGNQIPTGFTNSTTYPWVVMSGGYNSNYCAVPGNHGTHSSTSDLTYTVELTETATVSFYAKISSEGSDYGRFLIDETQKMDIAGTSSYTTWSKYSYELTAGTHTLIWRYYKDVSVNSGEDYFYVDNITIKSSSVGTWQVAATNVTESPYVLSNNTVLSPETNYQVKLKGYCPWTNEQTESNAQSFTTASSCETPSGLAESEVTNESAKITWETHGLTTFNLRYRTGTEGWEIKNNVTCPYIIEGLNGYTTYEVQVQATCNTAEWSTALNFTTKCDLLAGDDLPWKEDFESYSAGNFSDPCWVNEHIAGSAAFVFQVSTSNQGTNSTHQLQLPDEASGNMIKLALPGMNLPNNNYSFFIDVYRSNSTYSPANNPYEGIRIFASTNGEIEGATELAFIPRQFDEENGSIPAETEVGWYTYVLPINMSGTCYIVLRGESRYCTSTYMDNFMVASCYPVGTLSLVEYGSTSAKLSWTLKDDTQTAWDVAYKMEGETNFTIVSANTNENYLLEGLTAEKAYTVKVRANCGGGDYGVWSNEINFTTPEACPIPTDLDVNESTKTAVTADLSWTGSIDVTSYDIRYRTAAGYDGIDEQFNTSSLPSGWTKYTGLVDNVIAGSATLSTGGNWGTSTYALGSYNAKLNIYGTSRKDWLVTPEINLPTGAVMSFKLALTDFSNADPIEDPTAQADDRFVVLVYADNQWTNLREWNNSGSEYVYNTIATTGETVNDIDISRYVGKTVKFAFYGESTATGGDNDLHIDDVTIGAPITEGRWNDPLLTSNTTNVQLTNLAGGTKYDVQVRSGCSTSDADWSETLQFTTLAEGNMVFTNATADGKWGTVGNWVPAQMPVLTDEVILRANATIESGCVAEANSISGTGTGSTAYTLTIKDGGQLKHNSGSVRATVEKTIQAFTDETNGGWKTIASPISNSISFPEGLTTNGKIYKYDEPTHYWRYYAGTGEESTPFTTMANQTGYLYGNDATVTIAFTGTLVTSGSEVEKSGLSYTPGNAELGLDGWNLVGNPFACNAYADKPYYVAEYDAQAAGNVRTKFTARTLSDPIAPCTGILVKASSSDDISVKFKTSPYTRESNNGSIHLVVAQQVINRGVSNTVERDNAIVSFNEGDELAKFVFNEDNAKLYIPQDDKEFAIVSVEGEGEMPVNFRAAENGSYTIRVNAEGVDMAYLHLIDNKTGNDIDLLQTPSYTFNATTTDYESRFRLVFVVGSTDDSETFAFCNNGNWIIANEGRATLQVIDITGRVLSSETVNGSVSKAIQAAPGVYMLRLINGDNVKVQKIVVR